MNVAFVAHDSKKKLMQNLCIAYRSILAKHTLYATGTTGRLIEEVTNLNIHKFLAGHIGGEEQLGAMIDQNQIDLVIFFRDPLNARKNELMSIRQFACVTSTCPAGDKYRICRDASEITGARRS